MDPLSVVSGISGTVAVGAKVLVALHGFAKGVKSAPEELKLLTRELEDLCKIMDNFRKKTGGHVVNQGIEDSSAAILDIFMQLNQLITEHTVSKKDGFLKKGWKQVKWHYIEKDIADLRVHLNSNKGNLLVALTLANELQNGHSNMKLERVQGALEEVIERLQDHNTKTVATCESFTLQRWQDVPSTIAPSSRPATPNGQTSAARSESGILSEAGFSERSIPMSAYQFNDMGNRGKGVLVSDGTQTKAYTVKAGSKKKASNPKPPEAGVTRAGSPASSSKPQTRSMKPTPLSSIPEPEEGDAVLEAKDYGKLEMAAVSRTVKRDPSKSERLQPSGALRGVRHRLKNLRKAGPKANTRTVPEDLEHGGVVHGPRDTPLAEKAPAPTPSGSPKLAMEKFLQNQDSAPKDTSNNPINSRKLVVRKAHAIWPPQHDGVLSAGKLDIGPPLFLEPIEGSTYSRDDSFLLSRDQFVRVISYTDPGWFYGQVYPGGLILQFQRSDFRIAVSPTEEELQEVLAMQVKALIGEPERLKGLNAGLGIGGVDASKHTFGMAAVAPRIPVVVT
ncbi:unnamed protein product [Tuber aestivum]|uniref:Azaphilone pigments biosynthesis cluster protein L N-terminal domain-containing protein n=1 Tax=Tuber aestivum TaxID=59557 RepID=A0A292PM00_9PEZI|nr:unnamed protein product [Tuber aestivum]